MNMKIAVIGGGIFGITAAFTLSQNNEVDLFEKNSDLLLAASGSNQYRVHRGYHYPRSKETVAGIIKSENSFRETFEEAIVDSFDHYYCISKKDSLTSAKQFLDFNDEHGLEYTISDLPFMNKSSIELCIRVNESVYDPIKLRQMCWEKLKKNNVNVFLNREVTDNIFDNYDMVVIATYVNINKLVEKFPNLQNEYQFELCEKPVVKLPEQFKNKSVVIMDGPFMCIDPLANTNLHLLCNVAHEIHQTNIGKYPEIDQKYLPLLDKGIVKNPSLTNFDKFIDSTIPFIPEIKKAEHVGSMFTMRVVPPYVEETDERPTMVRTINEQIITVFSGKITTCVDAANDINKLIAANH